MAKLCIIIAVVISTTLASTPSIAQKAEQQSPAQFRDLLQCRLVVSTDERLRCFDSAAGKLMQAAESGAIVIVDQETIKRTRRSLFGLSLPSLSLLGRGQEEGAKEIQSTIRAARPFGYNMWLITLEDGAVWQTTEADTYSRSPKSGDAITIRGASLGGYRLTWKGSRTLGAKRIS